MGLIDKVKGWVDRRSDENLQLDIDTGMAETGYSPEDDEYYPENVAVPLSARPGPGVIIKEYKEPERGITRKLARKLGEKTVEMRIGAEEAQDVLEENRERRKEEARVRRLEKMVERKREADLAQIEANIATRERGIRDQKRTAESDSLKSKVIGNITRGLGLDDARPIEYTSGGGGGGGGGGGTRRRRSTGGRRRSSTARSTGRGRTRPASPMSYNPMSYKTNAAGFFATKGKASYQDMDIFGRYGPGDLDLYGQPRNGRLTFSTNLFP